MNNLLVPHTKSKRKKWPYILFSLFLFFALIVGGSYYYISQAGFKGLFSSSFFQNQIKKIAPDQRDLFDLLPDALGLNGPKTYVLLFLNNTELRPGGGFIGVYATVRLNQGDIEILQVEGTELLDVRAPVNQMPDPPKVLSDYLKVSKWYFRDSNWSPDFGESSMFGLELYKKEGGVAAEEIDAVVGVTATVLEELMQRAGPLTVDGITFTPQNVVAELEHEVEYNFRDRGIARSDRKDIVETLMRALIDKLKRDIVLHPLQYKSLVENLIAQKHIIAYAVDPQIAETLRAHSLDGKIKDTLGDYLSWIDANLGALKTDHALSRTLSYRIETRKDEQGHPYYAAIASMQYVHTKPFDWRTSRYQTYARVYTPIGSELISVEAVPTGNRDIPSIEQGNELGKQWFGTFILVEPLTTKTLTFTYRLPDSIATQITDGSYTLLLQKQIGVVGQELTLDLDFGTTIQSATPAENASEWGDTTYRIDLPLDKDQMFGISFK